MKTLTCYMSHHIRGPEGDSASHETQSKNKKHARAAAIRLRYEFPNLRVYCPGDQDDWADVGYRRGLLSMKQILDIDCAIIGERDVVILYDQYGELSGGMQIEKDHAVATDTPTHTIHDFSDESLHKLLVFLNGVATDGQTTEEDDLGHRD